MLRVNHTPLATSLLALAIALAACADEDSRTPDAAAGDIGQVNRDLAVESGPTGEGGVDGPGKSCSGPGEDTTRSSKCSADTFSLGGRKRGMIVCRPDPLPAGALPVVLAFHGGGGNATQWKNSNPWHETAARHGFVVVFMQGCKDALTDCSKVSGSYLWTVGKKDDGKTIDDQAYVLEALKRLEQVHQLSLDKGCRFATGHSLGGIFSYSLLCDRPDLFNAVGPISATPTDATCTPHGGTSIFHIHGKLDANVPFDTGCCSMAQQTKGAAAYLAACDTLPRCFNPTNWWPPARTGKHPFGDVTGLDALATQGLGCGGAWKVIKTEGKTTCSAYPGCAGGRAAEVCLVEGVKHSLQDLNQAFDTRAYLWGRFAGQRPR